MRTAHDTPALAKPPLDFDFLYIRPVSSPSSLPLCCYVYKLCPDRFGSPCSVCLDGAPASLFPRCVISGTGVRTRAQRGHFNTPSASGFSLFRPCWLPRRPSTRPVVPGGAGPLGRSGGCPAFGGYTDHLGTNAFSLLQCHDLRPHWKPPFSIR